MSKNAFCRARRAYIIRPNIEGLEARRLLSVNPLQTALGHSTHPHSQIIIRFNPDFTLSHPDASIGIAPGTSATESIVIKRLFGSTGGISFSLSGLPLGISAKFIP